MNNIKQIRKAKGISVTELAQLLNMSQGNLTKIENGQVDLKTGIAQKIASALGCPLERLFAEGEQGSELALRLNLPLESRTFAVRDDTMAPTFASGDIAVYLPASAKKEDGVYLIRQQGRELIRRLQTLENGEIAVLCDNKGYLPQQQPPEKLSVIGRLTHKVAVHKI